MPKRRVAFVGDVHIANHKKFGGVIEKGINDRCRLVLNSLLHAYVKAEESGVDTMVILGDLFDSPRVSPQIIAETQKIVGILPTIILCGNHDQFSDAPEDNALAPLSPVAEIVDSPDIIEVAKGVDLLLVPYQKGKCSDWLKEHTQNLLKQSKNDTRILAFHAGISDEHTPYFLKDSDASIPIERVFDICREGDIEHVFAGHWHNKKVWGLHNSTNGKRHTVFQAGALVPTGFNNPGRDYGVLYEYLAHKNQIERSRIPGPRFVKFSLEDGISELEKNKPDVNSVYIKVATSGAEAQLALDFTDSAKDKDLIKNAEIEVHDDSQKVTEEVIQKMKSAESFDEALIRYTDKMALKNFEDVSEESEKEIRKVIHQQSQDYMKVSDAY